MTLPSFPLLAPSVSDAMRPGTGFANSAVKALGVTALVAAASLCNAACWVDASLNQQAQQLARQLLPELRGVPRVSVCTPEHFSGAVTGLFRGGADEIWIHQAHAASWGTRQMLIHELAHALVFQQYGPQDFAGGHGPEWMRLMVRLGPEQVEDARFHSNMFPEAQPAFAQALAGAEPARRPRSGYQTAPIAQQGGTTFAAAEADRQSQSCARVLMVPAGGGVHGYELGQNFHSFTPLPLGTQRIRSIRWVRPGTLELETLPTRDGTPSLLCLG